jgi:cell division protein ZapA
MKQLEVQILGQSYLLGCPDGGDARLLEAVERVDTAMCKIRDSGKVRARDRIAVLAALNLAFDLSDQHAHQAQPAAPITSGETAVSGEMSARLGALLKRLDEALARDEQLL